MISTAPLAMAMSGDVEQAGGNNTDEAGGIESGMLERLRFAGR